MTRNGKIARLPKDLRDLVNRMLDDGAQYRSVILELNRHRQRWPADMTDINEDNLSNWKSGGYQDGLLERDLQQDIGLRRDFAVTLADSPSDANLNDMVHQIGVLRLYHILAHFDHAAIQSKLQDDPVAYARLLNSFARLSRSAFDIDKYKDHVRQRKERIEAQLNQASVAGGLSDEAIALIHHELKLL